jgi:siroheme synthase
MGLSSLASVAASLIAEGHAPATPALVVSNATRTSQRHVLATLSTIATRTRAARVETPAILFVGAAVATAALPAPSPAPSLRLVRTA